MADCGADSAGRPTPPTISHRRRTPGRGTGQPDIQCPHFTISKRSLRIAAPALRFQDEKIDEFETAFM
jgi:hypothetical protein